MANKLSAAPVRHESTTASTLEMPAANRVRSRSLLLLKTTLPERPRLLPAQAGRISFSIAALPERRNEPGDHDSAGEGTGFRLNSTLSSRPKRSGGTLGLLYL